MSVRRVGFVLFSCVLCCVILGMPRAAGQADSRARGRLIFIADEPSGNGADLYSVDFEDGGVTRLTDVLGTLQTRFVNAGTCYDDGHPIVYFEAGGFILSVNLDDSTLRQIMPTVHRDESPQISSDGNSLAFVDTAGMGTGITIAEINGASPQRILSVSGYIGGLTWSPDSQFIAAPVYSDVQSVLRILSRNGGTVRDIFQSKDAISGLAWSPEGDRIAFSVDDPEGSILYLIAPDGRQLTQISPDTSNNAHPLWSPDGQFIIFSSDRGHDGFQLYSSRPDGSDVERIHIDGLEGSNKWAECWLLSDAPPATDTATPLAPSP